MSEEAPRKRSRFDQTEPEPRKNSRFDRRSRSPVARDRDSESRRSRSPLAKSARSPSAEEKSKPKTPVDPAAAAAAAAARINAQIEARRGIQHVDVPPIQSADSHAPAETPKPAAASSGNSVSKVDGDIYIADGDYIKDVEVNDLRNRYTLTKGSTQKMIKEETGADVTTRGSYYPDKSMATAANPPLYLHVTSTSKEGLEKAVEKIEELMQQELPNLVDERRFRKREPDYERDELGRRKWPEAKILIDMENIPGFNLRAQVVGQGGAYVKHIQSETRCRVQIKGKNSGFMEHSTGQESDEPMYLHVASPDQEQVDKAKKLCEDLLASVRQNYEHFKANPPPARMESYTDGYGADANRGSYGGGGYGRREDRRHDSYASNNHSSYSQNGNYAGTPTTPTPAASQEPSATQSYQDQWAAYYASNPQADPYAAYGGYQAYMQYYYSYYQQQGIDPSQAQGGTPQPPQDHTGAPPPPPANNGYDPTNPAGYPGAQQPGGYNAVPPPPGM
ncbi:hypothetical protein LTR51_002693 [Lithohypha guttulata]|uniref:K Homology domain-containing protein n=1 Tax=Lithohypha guttulata TaxID=1690604 RepID=A0AAN7SVR1_9EURO|nr:hypothetical protein LTR51_002693 [Lithohypha guttulata]KAK5082876.1 hypothetical protein LTR05_006757 [Lithohypha guttulata]